MINTYSIKFPRVKTRLKLRFLTWSLILISFTIAFIVKDTVFWVVSFIIVFICGIGYQYLMYSREDPQKYFDKTVVFDINKIIIGNSIYDISLISNLKIFINEFDEEKMHLRGGVKILNGTNNQVSFSHLNENIFLRFYIISEIQKEHFITLFVNWYKMKVRFYEGTLAGRTYLLKALNYQEIQEFKKKYEIL